MYYRDQKTKFTFKLHTQYWKSTNVTEVCETEQKKKRKKKALERNLYSYRLKQNCAIVSEQR
jgi:hypothetical protein